MTKNKTGVAGLALAGLLTGCVAWHPVPEEGSPAAELLETSERQGLYWYHSFGISEIDGQPVSHMFSSVGGKPVRVAPGKHKVLIRVRYLHSEQAVLLDNPADCPCEARFDIELDLRAGQRLQVGGSIDRNRKVKLTLTDVETQQAYAEREGRAAPIPRTRYVPIGSGAYMPLPARESRPNE